ncbi:hypothetical protein GCM10009117_22040 [Gangjinia marincola]|uniref:DUF4179 domain-containing protein n=1 Tax=Gangjinia marincola TaxID=578463 RepID=A0ABN1MIR3_9FLAO
MSTNKHVEDIFKELSFDLQEPTTGHRERFTKKLSENNYRRKSHWPTWLSIAASIVLIMSIAGLFIFSTAPSEAGELGSVSKEMKQTQSFYSAAIEHELNQLKNNTSPEAKQLIQDAMIQITLLEARYDVLKSDLIESEQDQRVIFAMINNFQQRIDLLKEVMEKIQTINELKSTKNENQYL